MSTISYRQGFCFWGFIGVCLLTCIWLLSVFIGSGRQDTEVLRFAHVYETGHPLHLGALKAAEIVSKETNGRVEVKVYPASSLGKEMALNEALTLGVVDIIYTGTGFAGATYGPISITDFPFTLRDLDHWAAYKESVLFDELSAGYKEATKGNEVAALSYFGARHMLTDRPILHPTDMENLKIRVPNAPAYVMFPQVTGANPTPIAFAEAYLALQQGVVDGMESPLPVFKLKRFHEVRKHISLTSHIINSILTITSANRLDSLLPKDAAIVRSALLSSADWVTDEIIRSEADLLEWFKSEGVNVYEVDVSLFREAVKPALTDQNMPFSADIYTQLQSISNPPSEGISQ